MRTRLEQGGTSGGTRLQFRNCSGQGVNRPPFKMAEKTYFPVPLSGLHTYMSEQKLNLLKLSTSGMAQPGAGASVMPHAA